jgi:hypothetical protein
MMTAGQSADKQAAEERVSQIGSPENSDGQSLPRKSGKDWP